MSLLELKNISKEFRLGWVRSFMAHSNKEKNSRKVLDDISWDIREGERWGLLGRNGSGKTTLLKIAAGILKPTAGQIQVNSHVTALFTYHLGMADDLTLHENMYLAGAVLGIPPAEIRRQYDSILQFSELEPHLKSKLRTFSEGMRARLMISLCLHTEARLFMFDEIISAVDQAFQEKCISALSERTKNGCGLILITHEPTILQRLTEKSVWLENGQLRLSGPTESVLMSYRKGA